MSDQLPVICGVQCIHVPPVYFPVELIVQQNLLATYERLERRTIDATYNKRDRVLEGGAGIGISTLNLSWRAGFVVAYEPLSDYARIARKNLEMNNVNVEVHNAALAPKEGRVLYNRRSVVSASSGIASGYGDVVDTIEVDCVSIDAEVKKYNINCIHLDIEGSEYEILTQMNLEPINKITVEIHPGIIGLKNVDRMFRHLQNSGFVMAGFAGDATPDGGILRVSNRCVLAIARPEFVDEIRTIEWAI